MLVLRPAPPPPTLADSTPVLLRLKEERCPAPRTGAARGRGCAREGAGFFFFFFFRPHRLQRGEYVCEDGAGFSPSTGNDSSVGWTERGTPAPICSARPEAGGGTGRARGPARQSAAPRGLEASRSGRGRARRRGATAAQRFLGAGAGEGSRWALGAGGRLAAAGLGHTPSQPGGAEAAAGGGDPRRPEPSRECAGDVRIRRTLRLRD